MYVLWKCSYVYVVIVYLMEALQRISLPCAVSKLRGWGTEELLGHSHLKQKLHYRIFVKVDEVFSDVVSMLVSNSVK